MTYISPASKIVGVPQEINYNPLIAVENVNLSITTDPDTHQSSATTSTTSLWEFLAHHIDQNIKLPSEVREVLLQTINPQVSLTQRLELPFVTSSNEIAVEVFWGNHRILVYNDPKINDLVRCLTIPYDNTDPERYLNSAH